MNNIIKLTFLFAFISLYNPLLSQIQEKNTLFIEAIDVKSIFSNNSPRIGATLGTNSCLFVGASSNQNIFLDPYNQITSADNYSLEYRRFFKAAYIGYKISYTYIQYDYLVSDGNDEYYVYNGYSDALVGHLSVGYLVKLNNYLYVDGNTTFFYNTYWLDASTNNSTPYARDFGVTINCKFGLYINKRTKDYISSKYKM